MESRFRRPSTRRRSRSPAVDFIFETAGSRPCVINLSVGRHGGPHDGSTLVEQGLDAALLEAPGRAICQSTGNYYDERIHASGEL